MSRIENFSTTKFAYSSVTSKIFLRAMNLLTGHTDLSILFFMIF